MIGTELIGEQPVQNPSQANEAREPHPVYPASSFASTGTKPELRRTCQGAGPLARLPTFALDRTFAVPVHTATMEAEEDKRKIGSIPPFGITESGMSADSKLPTSDLSSHPSGYPFTVSGAIEPWFAPTQRLNFYR